MSSIGRTSSARHLRGEVRATTEKSSTSCVASAVIPATVGAIRSSAGPAIYIAGKIGRHDFRHELVPGLRGYRHHDRFLDCGAFRYCGPFFAHCDHACAHGPSSHGVLGAPNLGCEEFERTTQFRVWQRNMAALREATAVFAYIETNDAFGTLVELGAAQALQTPTWVLFAPGVDANAMWYAAQGAVSRRRRGGFSSDSVHREDLPNYFEAFLRRCAK